MPIWWSTNFQNVITLTLHQIVRIQSVLRTQFAFQLILTAILVSLLLIVLYYQSNSVAFFLFSASAIKIPHSKVGLNVTIIMLLYLLLTCADTLSALMRIHSLQHVNLNAWSGYIRKAVWPSYWLIQLIMLPMEDVQTISLSIIMGKDHIPNANISLPSFLTMRPNRAFKRSVKSTWGGSVLLVIYWWCHLDMLLCNIVSASQMLNG